MIIAILLIVAVVWLFLVLAAHLPLWLLAALVLLVAVAYFDRRRV